MIIKNFVSVWWPVLKPYKFIWSSRFSRLQKTKNHRLLVWLQKKHFDGFGCWYGYKTKFWWFRLLVWLQNKFLMVSVVGMVTKQIFDGFGCWYGYKKKFWWFRLLVWLQKNILMVSVLKTIKTIHIFENSYTLWNWK